MGKNKKTTVAGLVKIAVIAAGFIGVNVAPESQETVVAAVLILFAAAEGIGAWYQADKEDTKIEKK